MRKLKRGVPSLAAVMPIAASTLGAGLVPVYVAPANPTGEAVGLTLPRAVDMSLHERIEADRTRALPDAFKKQKFRQYVNGDQPIALGAEEKAILAEILASGFCDNVSKKVVTTLSSRLRFSRFNIDTDNSTSIASAGKFLGKVEQKNGLRTLFHDANISTLRDGDCAICIGWEGGPDDGKPLLSRELFFDGVEGVYLHYGDDNKIEYAVKDWSDAEGKKRTIFFPDHIRRYFIPKSGAQAVPAFGTQAGQPAWQPYSLPNDPEEELDDGSKRFVWPVPWLDVKGEPIGVPFVHLRNPNIPNDGHVNDTRAGDYIQQAGKDGVTHGGQTTFHSLSFANQTGQRRDPRYGVSELDGGVTAQNDVVNLCHVELASARRFTAFKIYYASGVAPVDDDGKKVVIEVRPGVFILIEDPAGKAGALEAGDLTQLASSLEIALRTVSRNTEIPMHVFTGDWPSGTAMFQSESGLNFKMEKIADALKPAWGSVGFWCLKLSNIFAGTSFDLEEMVTAVFDNVARLDPLTLAEWAKAVSPYVSRRECQRILGYSDAEMVRIEAEIAAEKKLQQQQEQSLADIALGRFNLGRFNTDANDNPDDKTDDGSDKGKIAGNKDPIPPKPAKAPTEP